MVAMLLDHGIGGNWPAAPRSPLSMPFLVAGSRHTCLSMAVYHGDAQMVQSLIDAGATADPDLNDPWGCPSMGYSLQRADQDLVLGVLQSDVYTTPWHYDFTLIADGAVRDVDRCHEVSDILIAKLEALVEQVQSAGQASPIEPYHGPALVAACIYGLPDMIAPLVKHGVDVNVACANNTGLSHAVGGGHTGVVQVLLELGANPNIPDQLDYNGKYEVTGDDLRMLPGSGAPSAADKNGTRPIHVAVGRGDETAMRLLIKYGADVNVPDLDRAHPIHIAAAKGQKTTVRLLIDHGADIEARIDLDEDWTKLICGEDSGRIWDMADTCALVAASRRGHLDVVDMLLGAADSVPMKQLDNAAIGAFDCGHDEVVARLVQEGVNQPLRRVLDDDKASSVNEKSMQHE